MSAQARVATGLTIGALTVLIGIVVMTVLVITGTLNFQSRPAVGELAEPAEGLITRADLMARYAEIAPTDLTATPAKIDQLADGTCGAIEDGTALDEIITDATDVYGPAATEVVELLVSYRCPDHLDKFK